MFNQMKLKEIKGNWEWNKDDQVAWFKKDRKGQFTIRTLYWWQRLLVWLRIMKDPRYDGSKVNTFHNDEAGQFEGHTEMLEKQHNEKIKFLIENDEVGQMESVKLEGKIEIPQPIPINNESNFGNLLGFHCVLCDNVQYKTPLKDIPSDHICDVCRSKLTLS